MRKAWRWIAAYAVVALLVLWWLSGGGPRIEPGSTLVLDVRGEYVDAPVNPVLGRLFGRREQPLLDLLQHLAKAERDERIERVVLRMGALSVGWGKADEIRDAIRRVSEAGRRTVAYLELEKLGGNREFYVATGADEVVMAPATRDPLLGLAAEFLFLGGLFEKIGVDVEYERIGEYKSAVESYAESEMSEPNREMTAALLDSVDHHFVTSIARARKLSEADVRAAIDEGVTRPERMVELGLVDRVAFFDEVVGGTAPDRLVRGEQYARVDPGETAFEPVATFALVYGTGAVVTGEGGFTPSGQVVLAADTVASAIEDASEDPSIGAIVFRVDSPGGSPLASDVVWRAIARARERGKPVVASFSDVAASGGYYVACGADRIVSQPATYTGSIGVFVLRPSLGGLLERLGVGVETMTRGARADLLLASEPLSPDARAVLKRDVESVYALFVERVARGRELSADAVDAVGRGRVWTGVQAVDAGLVDRLGGLHAAVLEGKSLAGLDPDDDVELRIFPAPKPLAEQIAEALGLAARAAVPAWPLPDGVRTLVGTLSSLPTGTPLLVPPGFVDIR
jgi:protease-4